MFIGLKEHKTTTIQESKRALDKIKSYNHAGMVAIEEASAISANALQVLTPTIRPKGVTRKILFAFNPILENGRLMP